MTKRPAAASARPAVPARRDPRRRRSTATSRRTSGPPEDSPEYQYMMERRRALDGSLPRRVVRVRRPLAAARRRARSPSCCGGSGKQAVVDHDGASPACCATCARDEQFGARVVPIIPDEARTFGMDALFRELEDLRRRRARSTSRSTTTCCCRYTEATRRPDPRGGHHRGRLDGQLHRRRHRATPPAACRWCRSSSSIRCSGSSGSATSSGQAADARARGFLLGATAGRTTLLGEGLQHQDGHSLVLASHRAAVPGLRPGVRLRGGGDRAGTASQRMYGADAPRTRRLLLPHPLQRELPDAGHARGRRRRSRTGSSRGLYRWARRRPRARRSGPRSCSPARRRAPPAQAAAELAEHYDVGAELWSATSYKRAARGGARGRAVEPAAPRPGAAHGRWSPQLLADAPGPIVAVTDFMKVVPDQIARFVPGPHVRAARHRRLRPLRHPRGAAPLLRDRPRRTSWSPCSRRCRQRRGRRRRSRPPSPATGSTPTTIDPYLV